MEENKEPIEPTNNANKKRTYNKSFLDSWVNAINGIIYATTTQGNVKKQLIIIAFAIVLSLLFELSRIEFIAIILSVVLIIITEMINTGIETLVDLYTDIYHPKAKIAKDVGAGAVVISALNMVIISYFIFFDKIAEMGNSVLENLAKSPVHIAFTTIVLTLIAAVALKAANIVRGKNGKRFTPSGQAMVSFAAATMIWVTTESSIAFALAIILALLICISRYEMKARTKIEIIFGALAGSIISALVYSLTLFF